MLTKATTQSASKTAASGAAIVLAVALSSRAHAATINTITSGSICHTSHPDQWTRNVGLEFQGGFTGGADCPVGRRNTVDTFSRLWIRAKRAGDDENELCVFAISPDNSAFDIACQIPPQGSSSTLFYGNDLTNYAEGYYGLCFNCTSGKELPPGNIIYGYRLEENLDPWPLTSSESSHTSCLPRSANATLSYSNTSIQGGPSGWITCPIERLDRDTPLDHITMTTKSSTVIPCTAWSSSGLFSSYDFFNFTVASPATDAVDVPLVALSGFADGYYSLECDLDSTSEFFGFDAHWLTEAPPSGSHKCSGDASVCDTYRSFPALTGADDQGKHEGIPQGAITLNKDETVRFPLFNKFGSTGGGGLEVSVRVRPVSRSFVLCRTETVEEDGTNWYTDYQVTNGSGNAQELSFSIWDSFRTFISCTSTADGAEVSGYLYKLGYSPL